MEVILKPTVEDDYEDYYMIRSCPGDIYWNGYITKPDKIQFKEGFLKRLGNARFEMPEDRRNFLIQIHSNDSEFETVGFIQLIKREDGIDIGYTVIEKYQGHGYATDALQLGINIAMEFDKRIYVQIRDDNIASQGVAKKCGFVRTEEYTMHDYPQVGKIALRKYRLPFEDKA